MRHDTDAASFDGDVTKLKNSWKDLLPDWHGRLL